MKYIHSKNYSEFPISSLNLKQLRNQETSSGKPEITAENVADVPVVTGSPSIWRIIRRVSVAIEPSPGASSAAIFSIFPSTFNSALGKSLKSSPVVTSPFCMTFLGINDFTILVDHICKKVVFSVHIKFIIVLWRFQVGIEYMLSSLCVHKQKKTEIFS